MFRACQRDEEFVTIKRSFGKGEPQQLVRLADTEIPFTDLGIQRTVVLETSVNERIGIYTTALKPLVDNEQQSSLEDNPQLISEFCPLQSNRQFLLEEATESILSERNPLSNRSPVMTAIELLDAMRFKQRIENQFKVEMHEMGSDVLPSHTTYKTHVVKAYNSEEKQNQLDNANKRLQKYATQLQKQQQLHHNEQLDKHQLNLLNKRTERLQQQTEEEIEMITKERKHVQSDENGQLVLLEPTEVLEVRKLTLFNLFKLHASVALKILAGLLGLDEANPERLRRSFLSFGTSVEFDHEQRVATVYTNRFPRHQTKQAYQRLCELSRDEPIILTRKGIKYQVRFNC